MASPKNVTSVVANRRLTGIALLRILWKMRKICFNVETSCNVACLCVLSEKFDEVAKLQPRERKRYFLKAQFRGKAFVNKITLAQQDGRLGVTNITKTKT